ncbi:MAG: DUF1559 domain-containing protein [Planctomycetaceae bacterium]|mgnify:CR=1 FL=1|jgi:hypothetical protein|nr:DUF1559 domain-containing protein [Planctomycetaceae bacterium]
MTDQPQTEPSPPTNEPYQFGLRSLLALPLLIVVYFALAIWVLGGCLATALTIPAALLLLGCYDPATCRYAKPLLGVYMVLAVIVLLLLPAFPPYGRVVARRTQCSNNLKQIAVGLLSYHDAYGSFPPAFIADENAKPVHSWRVLILPFVEQDALYRKYDLSEPWDSPKNRSLASIALPVFCCPADPRGDTTYTSYVLITGEETGWIEGKCPRLDDVVDSPSETIMLAEIANSNIHWMEPRDLTLSQAMRGINATIGVCISSHHPNGANVACADGSVHFLPNTLPASEIRALITIAGGERIHPGW